MLIEVVEFRSAKLRLQPEENERNNISQRKQQRKKQTEERKRKTILRDPGAEEEDVQESFSRQALLDDSWRSSSTSPSPEQASKAALRHS